MNIRITAALALAITFTTAFAQQKGTFKDARDGKTYKTVKIGGQGWMAENLSYRGTAPDTIGVCYDNKAANCTKYGRLYDSETAKKACPDGWHLPTYLEWTAIPYALGFSLDEKEELGKKLKSKSGWNSFKEWQGYNAAAVTTSGNGTDNIGFSALPGGGGDKNGSFKEAGEIAYMHGGVAFHSGQGALFKMQNMAFYSSIRCVQGSELTADEIKREEQRQGVEKERYNVKWEEGELKREKGYLTQYKCGTNKEDKSSCESVLGNVDVATGRLHAAKRKFYQEEEKFSGQINKDYIPSLLEYIKYYESKAKKQESESSQYKCRANEADVEKCRYVLGGWDIALGEIDSLKQEVYRLKGSGEKVSNDERLSLLADYVKLPEKQAKLYESESNQYKCLTDNMDVNKCSKILKSWYFVLSEINGIKNQIYALKGSKEKANTDAYFSVRLAHNKSQEKYYLKEYEQKKCRAMAEERRRDWSCWDNIARLLKSVYDERQNIYKEKGSNEQVNIDPYIAMLIDDIKTYESMYERTKDESDKRAASKKREELLKEYPNHPLVKKLQEAKK
ncbi:MAG: hypothetical protein LBH25_00830 [Fibromonadaceae bacterium]|jgi:uncharacterized protein (TIGR02145 family)|nr:hypothetical protein [Fibromonadaceae bacterium]